MNQPGLHLPPAVGLSDQDENTIAARWDTQPRVEAELANEGFFPVQQPEFVFPNITQELLTSPNTGEYTEAYRCSVAWVDYTRDKLARTQLTLLQMKRDGKLQ